MPRPVASAASTNAPKPKADRRGPRARSGPPSPEEKLTSKLLTVRLPPPARAAIDALAKQWGLSVSATVARIAIEAGARAE